MDALTRYQTKGHLQVEGWLWPGAMELLISLAGLQRALGVRGGIGEIGVHHGRLFILLHLLSGPDELSAAWDLFEDQDQNLDASGRGDYARLEANLKAHGCDLGRIQLVKANSAELDGGQVREVLGGGARLFSVDGGHTADLTYGDLRTASSALAEGGILILDDFYNEQWPGVAEGAQRFLADHPERLFPVAIGGNKVFFTHSAEWARRYQEALAAVGPRAHKISELAGTPVLVFRFPPARGPAGRLLRRLRRLLG
ncbi:MAG: class I SAM-dependent methyltransferase [Candidatus Handelsmanbacteria bacterium]|nr:class I SAM-dependent methyltransferase [Candidatus Handelsmanbacteria bacterium]